MRIDVAKGGERQQVQIYVYGNIQTLYIQKERGFKAIKLLSDAKTTNVDDIIKITKYTYGYDFFYAFLESLFTGVLEVKAQDILRLRPDLQLFKKDFEDYHKGFQKFSKELQEKQKDNVLKGQNKNIRKLSIFDMGYQLK